MLVGVACRWWCRSLTVDTGGAGVGPGTGTGAGSGVAPGCRSSGGHALREWVRGRLRNFDARLERFLERPLDWDRDWLPSSVESSEGSSAAALNSDVAAQSS
ncbi:hypothetical protein MTO96_048005 [Rhipicephalus appendiculatus]